MDIPFREGAILAINKPLNWTSFDVVNKVRWAIRKKYKLRKFKVGHAGTLDPLATGVLILCTGKCTKQIEGIQIQQKEYEGTFMIGSTTPSFDLETEVDKTFDFKHITEADVRKTAETFIGEQNQIAPLYSAKKINGKRAFDIARAGQTAELKPHIVTINEFDVPSCDLPAFEFRIACSKGTYIRSIARDMGERLDNGGHLTRLVRTRVGDYTLKDAYELDEIIDMVNNIEIEE